MDLTQRFKTVNKGIAGDFKKGHMKKHLQEQLKNLKKEIETIDPQDQETRAKFLDLAKAIEQKLNNPKDQDQHNAVLSRLEEDVIAFELKHPRITAVLDQIIDILKSSGV